MIDIDPQLNTIYKLAIDLKNAGNYAESEQLFTQLVQSFPNVPEIYFSYAQLKIAQKLYDQAKALVREALKLSQLSKYTCLLAEIYWHEKEYIKSKNIIRAELAKNPADFWLIQNHLMFDIADCNFDEAQGHIEKLLLKNTLKADETVLLYGFGAICAYLKDDMNALGSFAPYLEALINSKPQSAELTEIPNVIRIYAEYILKVYKWRLANQSYYSAAHKKEIYLVGDSHCLASAHMVFDAGGVTAKFIPKLVLGAKAWHLNENSNEPSKAALKKNFAQIPAAAEVILSFGEIDCRPQEGIFAYIQKNPNSNLNANIEKLVEGYVNYTTKLAKKKSHQIYYTSVIPPHEGYVRAQLKNDDGLIERFLAVTPLFNHYLKQFANDRYIDVYGLTVGDKGFAKDDMHIDQIHLKPNILPPVVQQKLG